MVCSSKEKKNVFKLIFVALHERKNIILNFCVLFSKFLINYIIVIIFTGKHSGNISGLISHFYNNINDRSLTHLLISFKETSFMCNKTKFPREILLHNIPWYATIMHCGYLISIRHCIFFFFFFFFKL